MSEKILQSGVGHTW